MTYGMCEADKTDKIQSRLSYFLANSKFPYYIQSRKNFHKSTKQIRSDFPNLHHLCLYYNTFQYCLLPNNFYESLD
jgi:hypothetical protein